MSSPEPSPATESTEPGSMPGAVSSSGRRRLIQGGLAATPVLAILKSRQVLASTSGAVQCRAVSAYLSASPNISHQPGGEICTGRTPGYWQTHPEAWRAPLTPGACADDSKNGTCKDWTGGRLMTDVWGSASGLYASATMMEVLWWGGNKDSYQMGAHLVAAALNNKAGHVSETILPWSTILRMGNAVLSSGLYRAQDSPPIDWNGEDVVEFLKQTMPL